MGARKAAQRPIVIIGISRRSGTNYLASVLLCHRDCAAPAAPVAEDQLLRDAPLLERYARHTARRWPRRWGDREEAQAALERSLGSGLVSFLVSRTDGSRVVTRTPYTDNLRLAPTFLSEADILLLVRDGRSVAASLVRAWGWSHDRAIKEWRKGARDILSFVGAPRDPNRQRCLLVRYEDLVLDLDNAVDAILEFTGLDPAGFGRDQARDLPILGSSYLRDDVGRLTWQPTARTADFVPAQRFTTWSPAEHERFNWLAGQEQSALGYPVEPVDGRRVERALLNIVRDVTAPLRDVPTAAYRRVVAGLRTRRAEHRRRATGNQA